MKEEFSQLDAHIRQAERILLTTHEHLDGDAIGALLGFSHFLDDLGKFHRSFSDDRAPEYFDYLSIERLNTDRAIINRHPYDLIVMLDIGDVKRSYVTPALLTGERRPRVVSIDHHETRTDFAGRSVVDLRIVDRSVSSTSEIVYLFLQSIGATITRSIATGLLTGIYTDTGGFSNLGTTTGSFDVAANLLNRGVVLQEVNDRMWRNKSLTSLRLWGRALGRLRKDPATGLVSTAITQQDLADCGTADSEALDGIANFLNSLDQATAVLVLLELPDGRVKGSYRSTTPGIDVARLAAAYGGGGHPKAAGFTTVGSIRESETGWQVAAP